MGAEMLAYELEPGDIIEWCDRRCRVEHVAFQGRWRPRRRNVPGTWVLVIVLDNGDERRLFYRESELVPVYDGKDG